MASIKPDKDTGIYYLKVYSPKLGYTVKKSLKTKNEREAKKAADLELTKINAGVSSIVNPSKTKKLIDVIAIFFKYKKLRERTIKDYTWYFDKFISVCGNKSMDLYDKQDYLDYNIHVSDLKHSQNTQRIGNLALSSLFNFGVKFGYCRQNIIESIKYKPVKPAVIPIDELKSRIEYIKGKNFKHYLYCKLTYLLALRPAEAIHLHYEDFDFVNKEITLYNSKRDRFDVIPMLKDIEVFLKSIKNSWKESGKIFDYTGHDSIKTWVWLNHQKQYLDEDDNKNNENKNIYSLKLMRKTRGSELANSGVKPYFHMLFMRHKDIKTTYTFYTVTELGKMRNHIDKSLLENYSKIVLKGATKSNNPFISNYKNLENMRN